MRKSYASIILAICMIIPGLASAGDVIKTASTHSVKETMDKFEELIKSKGMGVFARVDHQKNAAGVDMEMAAAEVLIFGNPKGGTVLMQNDSAASLDLPLRVAVYEDADGKVWISYHNPQGLKDDYDVAGGAKVLDKVEGALGKLTSAAAN